MATLDDIYKLRQQLEESIRLAFVAMDFAAITHQNAPENFKQKTPRVEIKCAIGAANGHRFVCPDGITRYDRWRFTLAIQAVTQPNNQDSLNVLNEDYVSAIRVFCSTLAQISWTSDAFPNVLIAEPLRDGGSDDTLKAGDGIEYSTLSFTGTVSIRETAWPAA